MSTDPFDNFDKILKKNKVFLITNIIHRDIQTLSKILTTYELLALETGEYFYLTNLKAGKQWKKVA